jgi:hypothetical protein
MSQRILIEGTISTIDLLVLTCLDPAAFLIVIIIYLCYKTSYLNEEVNCAEPSPCMGLDECNLAVCRVEEGFGLKSY